ncbi:MAG: hypothetical protein RLN89_02555 [Parvibaculum sp.]
MTVRIVEGRSGSFLLSLNGGDAEVVRDALDAGVVRLQSLEAECLPDFDLIETGSIDVLPRSAVMRRAMEVLRQGVVQTGIEYDASYVPPVLLGALADDVLATMLDGRHFDSAYVVSGESGAFQIDMEGVLDVPSKTRGALWLEMIHGLRPGMVRGGIAFAGPRFGNFGNALTSGADIVSLHGATAAETALSALLVAGAAQLDASARTASVPPVEAVWDALSAGVRLLSVLRNHRFVRSGVLTLRGRGRSVGPIRVDRLVRFGVSDWR